MNEAYDLQCQILHKGRHLEHPNTLPEWTIGTGATRNEDLPPGYSRSK